MSTYQDFLGTLSQSAQGQDFVGYAQSMNVPVTYNPEINRLLVNNMPVNMANTDLQNQEGKLYGTPESYQQLLSPFMSGNQQMAGQIAAFEPYQTPDYINRFMSEMQQRQAQPYQYNFEDDPSVAAARQQLESSISEMAGTRGFMYGSVQQDLVQQQVGKLLPQFEQAAYAREQDFLNRQLNLAGVIMQWDQMQADRKMDDMQLIQMKADFMMQLETRELNMFKTMLDQRRFEMEFLLEQQQADFEMQDAENEMAWAKVDALGYADSETALALGIPVGTKASWVKKMIAEQEATLDQMKEKHGYDLQMLQVNAKIEKELILERERISVESSLRLMEQEYLYTTALAEQQETYRREIEAKEEAERAAAEAEALALAEAKAKQAAVDEAYKTQMNVEYNLTKAHLKSRFVEDGIVSATDAKDAVAFLYEKLKNEEISRATYNRLKAEYGLPDYVPTAFSGGVSPYVAGSSPYGDVAGMTYNTVQQVFGGLR